MMKNLKPSIVFTYIMFCLSIAITIYGLLNHKTYHDLCMNHTIEIIVVSVVMIR